jgi:energy-coupling factor transport system substrate-specific component
VGGSVGVLTNMLAANTFDPIASPYAVVSFALGFAAGLSRYLRWQSRPSRWILLWVVCVTVSSLLSTPINFVANGGQSGVPFGDAIYAALSVRLPRALAAFLGEVAVDFPDKLISLAIALGIAQAFLRRPADTTARVIDLDLKQPFAFVFQSPRWLRRTLMGVLCFSFGWLIVPALLFLGYLVELSRGVRDGDNQLPSWDHRWRKIKDGFNVASLFLIWSLPGIIVSAIGSILSGASLEPGVGPVPGTLGNLISAMGNAWEFVVLVIQIPVWAQYLGGGFRAALSVRPIIDRLRLNLSLTVVVAALTVILLLIGAVGLIGFFIGVLATLTYMSYVWAHLAGRYAHLTDPVLVQSDQPARVGT